MSAAISWKTYTTSDSDSAAAVSTVSGSFSSLAIDSAYPGANAIDGDPSKRCRVNYTNGGGASTAGLTADWGTNQTCRVVAALNCRLPSSGFASVNFDAINAAGTTQESTTAVALANLEPIPGTTDRFNVFAILSADRSIARLRFNVNTIDASASGYFEVGHLWAGPALVLSGASAGVDRDWRLSYADPSIVQRGEGGGYAAYRYPVRRVLEVQKTVLSYAQAIGTLGSPTTANLRALALEVGVSAPVVVIPRDTNAHTLQALSVYGLVSEPISIGHQGGDYYGTAMRVEEIR